MQSPTPGSDARLQAQQQIGFWSINLRTCTVTWDNTTAAIHGMPRGYAPTLQEALEFFPEPERARVVQSALAAFDTRTLFDIRTTIRAGSGSARVRLIGGRGYDANAPGPELHGIVEALPQDAQPSPEPEAEAEAEDANAGLFVAALVHELEGRTASIAMLSALGRDEADEPARVRERMDRIAHTAAQMQRIADAVHMLHAHEPPRRERLDASAMAAAALAAHIERHPAYARAWVTIAPGIELDGDPREIEIVLENLVGNALKFSQARPAPQVRIAVSWQQERTVLHVGDNGVGFDPGDAARIFELFTRRSDPSFAGTGVGLAITRHIVARHGGLVWAEGAPGKGATFSFYL